MAMMRMCLQSKKTGLDAWVELDPESPTFEQEYKEQMDILDNPRMPDEETIMKIRAAIENGMKK